MSYCCGHGPMHGCGHGFAYGPEHCCGHGHGFAYGPEQCCGHGHGHGPGQAYGHGPGFARGPRRRRARAEDLEEYLGDLEAEIAAVRAELDEIRGREPDQ
jgi:hypothetical protein